MDFRSAIHPAALDLMLGSASNAAQKGQSQYSTPVPLAAALAKDLPQFRPVLVDLTCGPGQLLDGCANKSTEHLLGSDVDPRPKKVTSDQQIGVASHSPLTTNHFLFIQADLTSLYEPMRQIDFRADCFVLNPLWSLNWHAGRLEGLADSAVPAVAKTFKAVISGAATIDSTLATFMIALDRLSDAGEGLLIGYSSTMERLIFAPSALGELLAQHVWKRLELKDMPQAEGDWAKNVNSWNETFGSATAIYFSRAHDGFPTEDGQRPRFLPRTSNYSCNYETVDQWNALTERAKAMLPGAPPKFNLTLRDNHIRVRLGLFDTALTKVNHELARAADRLNDLDGRNPMQVVMQRDERNFILGLLKPGAEWTVEPALRDAVQTAVAQYNAIRAPLVPLPKIQRLGYLDENDDILCIKVLVTSDQCSVFKAGERYPLATRSVRFTRTQIKPNLHGEEEELELSGQELAILVKAKPEPDAAPKVTRRKNKEWNGAVEEPAEGKEYCFMDGALRAANVKVGGGEGEPIDFTLQDLVDHFEIPDVPDIATIDPARYNAFVEQLHQLEQLIIK
jgi:hypothetical protein